MKVSASGRAFRLTGSLMFTIVRARFDCGALGAADAPELTAGGVGEDWVHADKKSTPAAIRRREGAEPCPPPRLEDLLLAPTIPLLILPVLGRIALDPSSPPRARGLSPDSP